MEKAKLRSHGVTVVEYEQDYGVAVEQGVKPPKRPQLLLYR
jgi:D-serine dehydratase